MIEIAQIVIEQAKQGNMKAFEELYKSTSSLVYGTAMRITRHQSDAEEITQDVYMKIFKNLKKFQKGTSLKAWLYRITVNTSLNVCRKRARDRDKRDDFDIAIATHGEKSAVRNNLEELDTQDELKELLNVLNPDQRSCIVLREIEGLSYQQIADAQHININTVRSRLKRARETLLEKARKKAVTNEV